MYIEFWHEDLEEIITKYLKRNNYKIIERPELVLDNGASYVKAKVENETNITNNNLKEAEKITEALLESSFWMAGIGHFDLSREQMTEIFKVILNYKDQEERIERLSALYDEWQL